MTTAEYNGLHIIRDGETPADWKNRIWDRLMHFRSNKYYSCGEADCFYANKTLTIGGHTYVTPCGIAICYSCDQLVYLGIGRLTMGERLVYDGLVGQFKTEKFRYINFHGAHWSMYQHWATACTGNDYRKIDFKDYMEIKQRISPYEWASCHQYFNPSANHFGKFRRLEPYTVFTNGAVKSKFGLWVELKLYSYVLWLENITRRIKRIRQKWVIYHTLELNKPRSLTTPHL